MILTRPRPSKMACKSVGIQADFEALLSSRSIILASIAISQWSETSLLQLLSYKLGILLYNVTIVLTLTCYTKLDLHLHVILP